MPTKWEREREADTKEEWWGSWKAAESRKLKLGFKKKKLLFFKHNTYTHLECAIAIHQSETKS